MLKFLKLFLILIFLCSFLEAEVTDTQVTMSTLNSSLPYDQNNQHGETEYETNVTIKNTNVYVDQFWNAFSWFGNGDRDKYYDIATSGIVTTRVLATFMCDPDLDPKGCSGQKPFLINQGTIPNGTPAGTEFRLLMDTAGNYQSSDTDIFYALDVFRDDDDYSAVDVVDGQSTQPKKPSGLIYNLLYTLLAAPVADGYGYVDSPELRNRYMANITYGVQEDFMVEKATATSSASLIYTDENNTADSFKRVSLIDYGAIDLSYKGEDGSCSALFLTIDSGTLTCGLVDDFLGLTNLLSPLVTSSDHNQTVHTDLVIEDTETTLLALAGKLNNKNYYNEQNTTTPDPANVTVLSNFLDTTVTGLVGSLITILPPIQPLTTVTDPVLTLLFGKTPNSTSQFLSTEFTFSTPVPLTFIETDGSEVTEFRHFDLKGLQSVYSVTNRECRVGFLELNDLLNINSEITLNEDEAGLIDGLLGGILDLLGNLIGGLLGGSSGVNIAIGDLVTGILSGVTVNVTSGLIDSVLGPIMTGVIEKLVAVLPPPLNGLDISDVLLILKVLGTHVEFSDANGIEYNGENPDTFLGDTNEQWLDWCETQQYPDGVVHNLLSLNVSNVLIQALVDLNLMTIDYGEQLKKDLILNLEYQEFFTPEQNGTTLQYILEKVKRGE